MRIKLHCDTFIICVKGMFFPGAAKRICIGHIFLASIYISSISTLLADEPPTRTHEERLVKIELGTLTEKGENEPTDLLITLKTDKSSYYIVQFTSIMTSDCVANLSSVITQAKTITERNAESCAVLHLLFGLRPDKTPDSPQANVNFYPARERRAKFNTHQYFDGRFPSFNGLFLSEMPVPKMPAALGGTAMSYKMISSTDFHAFCIIETQMEEPRLDTNSFLDGRITFDPPTGLHSMGVGHGDDNPFGLGTVTLRAYSNETGWDKLSRVIFYLTPVGIGIGEGKVPVYSPVAFADLKLLAEKSFKDQLIAGTMQISQVKVAGFDAYCITGILKQGSANISEYWLLLEPHEILRISVQSKDNALFNAAVSSVKSLKIAPK